MTTPTTQKAGPRIATKIRLHEDTLERAKYWAASGDFPSVNEFMVLAVEEKIARVNGDYDLPALEVQRLNQIIDELRAMSTNVTNLESVVTNGFDSLLGLTRGDSYLQDAEDGELELDEPDIVDDGLAGLGGGADSSGIIDIDSDVLSDGFGGAF